MILFAATEVTQPLAQRLAREIVDIPRDEQRDFPKERGGEMEGVGLIPQAHDALRKEPTLKRVDGMDSGKDPRPDPADQIHGLEAPERVPHGMKLRQHESRRDEGTGGPTAEDEAPREIHAVDVALVGGGAPE